MRDQHDTYLATLSAQQRAAMDALSARIATRLPEGCEAVISYKIPAWRGPTGDILIGIAAFKDHINVTPFSGSIVPRIKVRVEGEGLMTSKSAIRVPYDTALPDWVLDELIRLKLTSLD